LIKNADVLVMHKSLYFTFSQFAFAIRFIFYAAFCTVWNSSCKVTHTHTHIGQNFMCARKPSTHA